SAGDVYVTGWTTSNDFPVKNPLQGALGTSGYNAFVTELNPTLSALVYSTYLGANSTVFTPGAGSITLDSSDDAYLIGTASPGFPTVAGAYQATCPNTCGFLAKLNPSGSSILYSTYLGSGPGGPSAVAVDSSENAFLAGITSTASFPVVHPIQSCSAINGVTNSGNFLAEFNAAGALVFSTCLAINADVGSVPAPVLALDASGNVYLAGSSQSGLPLQNPIDGNPPAVQRPFVSEIDPNTNSLLFSSYVAGPLTYDEDDYSTGDTIDAITVDASGNLYLGGGSWVGSIGQYSYLPVFNPLQSYFVNNNAYCLPTTYCTYTDGFIIKISPAAGAAAALVPAELQFPPVAVGATSSPQATTIYDLGTDGLTVSNAAISGDFAIQSNNCASVPASGGSCAIAVTFTPTAMGTQNGTLTITDSSAGSPHTVALTGQGGTNNLTVSPTSLSFPSQPVGTTSSTQTLTLTAGVVAVGSLHLQASGVFSETNYCGTGLAALGTCQVQVTFTPTSSGSQSGTLTMTDSASNSPQTVSLTGTGAGSGLALGIAPGGSSSATVAAGSTAKYSLSIGGGGISGTASLSCTGAPTGATCMVPATEAVSATTATDFNVSVTTTSSTTGALRQRDFRQLPWLWASAVMGWVMLPGKARTKRSALCRRLWLPLLLLTFLCSCGGGSNGSGGGKSGGTPAGNYTLTVTAAVGSTNQPMSLTLTVQ
ncbi:MAG: choice-of-anchor D domain-containing protein, partial [Candidatus Sulfotelmatobacter sp.]